ncbi:unnamed protein product, partial [Ilex paraguariensis]
VAKESADVIILDDNFTTIVNVAKWGRTIYINIQKFVQFQLTVNVVALMINFLSACISGSGLLTVVQLLWVNLIMDTLGALALATEPPNEGLMDRPPVRRDVSFITKAMWRNIIGHSVYQLAVLLVLNYNGKQLLRLTGSDATAILKTFIFNAFVFCQMKLANIRKKLIMNPLSTSVYFVNPSGAIKNAPGRKKKEVFNEINSREIEKITFLRGMFDSWIFVGVMVSTVIFQVIIVQFLGTFASTVPLSWEMWLLSILIGAVSMPVAIVLKCIPVERENAKHHNGYDLLPSGPELA